MSTKLSIIIPTYNNQDKLSRCLQSLSQQTVFELYKNEVEVIVVDDGSAPPIVIPAGLAENQAGRAGIQKEKEKNWIPDQVGDDKTKIYRIEHSGAPTARNFGFKKSTGQYVFFCDSDVVFLKPDALEKMLNVLEQNPSKAYCYSSFKYGWKTFSLFPFDQEKLKQNNYIATMSLIRRRALEKISFPNLPFDESLKKFQDWDLWLSLLKVGETGILINEVLWQAQVGGSMSKWFPKIFYKIFKNNKKVQDYQKAKEIIIQKHKL